MRKQHQRLVGSEWLVGRIWHAGSSQPGSERENERGTYTIELTTAIMNGHVAPFAGVFAVGKELVHEIRE